MRLVTYNIHYGQGRDGRFDLDRIAAAVDGADVIALQEVERFWPRSGYTDQVKRLAKLLPEHWWVYGPNIDLASPMGFPGEDADRRRQFGNMILSRWPIASSRNVALPRGARAGRTMQRGALEGIVDCPSGPLRIYSTHLDYRSAGTRALQLAALSSWIAATDPTDAPWAGDHPADADGWLVGDEPPIPQRAVVMGDLNIAAGTAEYVRTLSAMDGLVDAWPLAGEVSDAESKRGAGRIDHVLVTAGLAGAVRRVWIDDAAVGSDHQPLWADLDV